MAEKQAQVSVKKRFTIEDLTYIGDLKDALKLYVKLSTNDETKQTTTSSRKNAIPAWRDKLSFNVDESSTLKAQVYAKHRILPDEYVGGAEIQVEALLVHTVEPVELTLGALIGAPDARFKGDQGILRFTVHEESTSALNTLLLKTQDDIAEMQDVPWASYLSRTEGFIKFVNAISTLHPYTQVAWGVLSVAYEALLAQKNRDDDIRGLVEFLTNIFIFLQDGDALREIHEYFTGFPTTDHQIDLPGNIQRQINILSLILNQATECGYFIHNYAKEHIMWFRLLKDLGNGVSGQIQEYKDRLNDLKATFQNHAILEIEITTFKILGKVNNLTAQVDFSEMLYSKGATYNPEKGCLPFTCQGIIDEIIGWVNSPADETPHLFWLNGVAGSGKSAIAHSVARWLSEQKRLGSFFGFDSGKADRGPEYLFSTIALDLGDLDVYWRLSLWNVIKDARALCSDPSVQRQFDNFMLKPAKALSISGPLLIVIDALDECGDPSLRKPILAVLEKSLQSLPSNFWVLLTSRAENDIVKALQQEGGGTQIPDTRLSSGFRKPVAGVLISATRAFFQTIFLKV